MSDDSGEVIHWRLINLSASSYKNLILTFHHTTHHHRRLLLSTFLANCYSIHLIFHPSSPLELSDPIIPPPAKSQCAASSSNAPIAATNGASSPSPASLAAASPLARPSAAKQSSPLAPSRKSSRLSAYGTGGTGMTRIW
jgi:hypothetical protein